MWSYIRTDFYENKPANVIPRPTDFNDFLLFLEQSPKYLTRLQGLAISGTLPSHSPSTSQALTYLKAHLPACKAKPYFFLQILLTCQSSGKLSLTVPLRWSSTVSYVLPYFVDFKKHSFLHFNVSDWNWDILQWMASYHYVKVFSFSEVYK